MSERAGPAGEEPARPGNGASTPDPAAIERYPATGNGGPVAPGAPGAPGGSTGSAGGPGQPPGQPVVGEPPAHPKRTRVSELWIGLTAAALVLLFLLIFIVQNQASAQINFFGASGSLPLGVALLLAAVCGVLLVAIPGYARIMQLRRVARRAGRR